MTTRSVKQKSRLETAKLAWSILRQAMLPGGSAANISTGDAFGLGIFMAEILRKEQLLDTPQKEPHDH